MYQRNVWRESLLLFALVVLVAYAVSMTLTVILVSHAPVQRIGLIILAGMLFVIVIALGLWLRNITEGEFEAQS